MAFSLAKDRGLSRSRFNRHSPGFNRHSPGFVCSVLRIADAGMAFSLAKDRGPSRSRFNRLAWFHLLRASDCGCGNGFLFSQRPRPVSQSLQNRHSPGFVCSVLRIADAGMAFSLAKDRGLSRCGMKCPHTDARRWPCRPGECWM